VEHIEAIQQAVLAWFAQHGRDLPWRRTRDPYAILVAETMLQQTQVHRVVPRWERFLARYPTTAALASAPAGDVIREWSGLGYNNRALRLHATARIVEERLGGRMPRSLAALEELPGVGPYTAAALMCFAFEEPATPVDANHRRVLGRMFIGPGGVEERPHVFRALAKRALPANAPWEWNQALMDLGATICTARAPACIDCPIARWCPSRMRPGVREAPASYGPGRQGHFEGSNRWYRGQIVRALGVAEGALSFATIMGVVGGADGAAEGALAGLMRDGVVVREGDGYRLP
jgi:A/G-specific adenine glycosylase